MKLYPPGKPVFPDGALPDFFRKPAAELCHKYKAPKPLIVTSILSLASLACQGLILVKIPNVGVKPTSLYFITIGDSGERKSTVDKAVYKVIIDHDKKNAAEYQLAMAEFKRKAKLHAFKESLVSASIKRKQKAGVDYGSDLQEVEELYLNELTEPARQRFVYSNTDLTGEGLLKALAAETKSAIINYAEGILLLHGKAARIDGFLNTNWDGDDYEKRRQSWNVYIADTRITMSVMAQKDVFFEYLAKHGKRARSSGFFARALMSFPDSTMGTRFNYPGEVHDMIHLQRFHKRAEQLLDMQKGNPEKKVLVFSPSAAQKICHYSNQIEMRLPQGRQLEDVTDFASKHVENVCRTAAILHYFCNGDSGNEISEVTLDEAIEINTYYLLSAQWIMSMGINTPRSDASELLHWMMKNGPRCGYAFSMTYLQQNLSPKRLRKKELLILALDILASNGYIKTLEECSPTNRAKSTHIIVERGRVSQNSHVDSSSGHITYYIAGEHCESASFSHLHDQII